MTSNKRLLSKIHKGLLKRNSKETNTLVVKMGERSEHLIKEDIQIIWKDVPHHFSCGKGKLKQQGDTNVLHRSVCLTPCDPIDCSPTGSSVHGVFQARIPVWVAISYSRGSSRPRDQTHIFWISCIGRQILHHGVTWEAQDNTTPLSADGQHPEHRLHQALEQMGSDRGAHSLLAGM